MPVSWQDGPFCVQTAPGHDTEPDSEVGGEREREYPSANVKEEDEKSKRFPPIPPDLAFKLLNRP